ncbi:MAG TPA: two-component regulator propeller domain-containing protein [Verrucomicrobiae bacterium]|nr:two-component regulator propeller domain-containing protein [Verrucomicrobiae bacterium]
MFCAATNLLPLGFTAVLLAANGRVALHGGQVATNDPGPAEQLVFRSWGTEAGLPHNTVNAIVQTRDGYLWLGTRDGLARFDGLHFTVFGLHDGLQSVEVQALFEDSQGTLWIGTSGGGLSRNVAGRVETVKFPERLEGSDSVSAIAEDGDQRLWIGTPAGLVLADHGQFVQSKELAPLERAGIRALRYDGQGGMWIATLARGLFEFRDHRLSQCLGPPAYERILAYCLLNDSAQNLWASIGNGTLLCRQSDGWHTFTETNGLPFAYITCLAEDDSHTLWAGSLDDGLYCFHSGHFSSVRKTQGLSANDIRSLCLDREGHLWVGTRTGGLNRLSRRKLLSVGAAQGLTNDYTRSVAETRDGVLWVGTTGGGLYRGSLAGFTSFAPYYAAVDSVLAARDGSLWWGASRGLFHLSAGTILQYTNEPWLGSAAVTALAEDTKGGLWAGTSAGRLAHYENGTFGEFPQRVARGPITSLAQDPTGPLWVGSMAGGLRRIDPSGPRVDALTNQLPSLAIRTLYLDPEKTLWIGTAGAGLSCYRSRQLTTFTAEQGFPAQTVVQIVEDDLGFLWFGTTRGVLRVRKQDLTALASGARLFLHPRAFGINEGMPAEECSSGFCPAGLKTRAGLVCIPTVKGLAFFDPGNLQTNSAPPTVSLEDILVNGSPLHADFEAATNLTEQQRITLVGGRDLEIHYTGISFDCPEKLRFRYQLEGVDRDWIEAGERRTAYYQHLPPGKFLFRVLACNADGVWSTGGPALAVVVQPYLWETTWFLTLVVLAILASVALASRLVERRRYHARLALIETRAAVERERLRISQDMHDDLGSILTQVSQLSDLGQSETGDPLAVKSQFERIGDQARAAVQALDEIVWATNPKNDNLAQFADYICRFADEWFENTRVRCWQEVPTALPRIPLTADIRHNVFLAIKEALTNVLKHSGATAVWLRLTLRHGQVCVTIEDNGRGLEPARSQAGGNGLGNMRNRLAESGGQVEIKSVPGTSMTVQFTFPLPGAEDSPSQGGVPL